MSFSVDFQQDSEGERGDTIFWGRFNYDIIHMGKNDDINREG